MVKTLAERRKENFVLWRPANTVPAPKLILCEFVNGNPPQLIEIKQLELRQNAEFNDLWEIQASECGLIDGKVYHYFFEVLDSNPYKPYCDNPKLIRCTDPLAAAVDWRICAQAPIGYSDIDRDPPAVIMYKDNALVACDPGGEIPDWSKDVLPNVLPPNNRTVIYELPTAWARKGATAGIEFGVGSFCDVSSLVDSNAEPSNFASTPATQLETSYLTQLGINALELLPPADSFVDREWGYATSNYFAPDCDLGFPKNNLSPTPNRDLAELITLCHKNGIRFFADMVMAFATEYAYRNINFLDFHVKAGSGDPDEYTLDSNGNRIHRDSFGGDLFKYNFLSSGFDPLTGGTNSLYFARSLMFAYLERWMNDFRIDGIRLDSVVNYGSWDFMRDFKDTARAFWTQRLTAAGIANPTADERFITVGEELSVPIDILRQNRLDGLWNENFKRMLRYAILGNNDEKEPSFEWTVRKLIDCRNLGFTDGTQAVNYVTSHDVEGYHNERLYNFLVNNSASDIPKRIKLAFACLLTAVGIPMIFAGEEFADQHDLFVTHPQKQCDPVNFDRYNDPWRKDIFDYVSILVKLRTRHDALCVNDTQFIHVDFNNSKRVLVWQRGVTTTNNPVIVVANFSNYETPDAFAGGEYVIPSFPPPPAGKNYREVTQTRLVDPQWIGREPIFPWEAKVYELI